MSQYLLGHVSRITRNNKEDLAKCLMDMARADADFCGDNGSDYLWEVAKEAGFNTNAKYCLSVAKKESTPKKMAEKFISLWMDKDSYYAKTDLDVRVKEGMLCVSLAFMY